MRCLEARLQEQMLDTDAASSESQQHALVSAYKGRASAYASFRAQELCESRGGRPGPPSLIVPTVSMGRKATLNLNVRFLARPFIETTGRSMLANVEDVNAALE